MHLRIKALILTVAAGLVLFASSASAQVVALPAPVLGQAVQVASALPCVSATGDVVAIQLDLAVQRSACSSATRWADDDNIVWGTMWEFDDNIVWGTRWADDDNIVWGTGGADSSLAWSARWADDDNIVWGTMWDDDNIVWGTGDTSAF